MSAVPGLSLDVADPFPGVVLAAHAAGQANHRRSPGENRRTVACMPDHKVGTAPVRPPGKSLASGSHRCTLPQPALHPWQVLVKCILESMDQQTQHLQPEICPANSPSSDPVNAVRAPAPPVLRSTVSDWHGSYGIPFVRAPAERLGI